MVTHLIAIVDDDDAVRRSTAALVRKSGMAAEEFVSGDAFLAARSIDQFSCILLDLRMPGSDGLSVLRQLGETTRSSPVLLITGHGEVEAAVAAMKLGAHDFLEKPYAPEDLLRAIEGAVAKGTETRKSRDLSRQAVVLVEALTGRQRQVLQGMLRGGMNKNIAHDLGLSVRTVEIYRAEVMKKLGVRSSPGAIRLALAAGMSFT